jgi:hypothetical protein
MTSQPTGINPSAPPSGTGCGECLGGAPPGWWLLTAWAAVKELALEAGQTLGPGSNRTSSTS